MHINIAKSVNVALFWNSLHKKAKEMAVIHQSSVRGWCLLLLCFICAAVNKAHAAPGLRIMILWHCLHFLRKDCKMVLYFKNTIVRTIIYSYDILNKSMWAEHTLLIWELVILNWIRHWHVKRLHYYLQPPSTNLLQHYFIIGSLILKELRSGIQRCIGCIWQEDFHRIEVL